MSIIEIIFIIIILCAQVYVAYSAWRQIESIRHFLSSEDHLKLKQTVVNLNEGDEEEISYRKLVEPLYLGMVQTDADASGFVSLCPNATIKVGDIIHVANTDIDVSILEIIYENSYVDTAYAKDSVEVRFDTEIERGSKIYKTAEQTVAEVATANVSVIAVDEEERSPLLNNVVDTINNYLKKNKGGAADFHLVKDIVERHTDTVDEEINHKLPVPIYLGLMGTVLGIVIGLFSLKFQFDPETSSLNGELFVNSVSGLISGVKLAMICSFFGLLFTTVLSSWRYMGAKSELEAQKNAFYDFIQTQLLPQMTKDAASTILALQANLEKFNTSFQENIEGFGDIMDDIHATFDSQVQLQKELKKMDLTQVANLNVNVLSQLRRSMTEFEKFTQYLGQMNSFVRSTAKLTDSINDQLQRTEAVETVVEAMQDNIKKNQSVMNKLRQFLERINEQQAIITAAGDIDSAMSQAITELKNHAQEQISSIRTYTTEATADLHELVTSERGHLRSLDKLGKLDQLDKLVSAINTMKDDNHAVNNALEKKIEALVHAVTENTKAQRGESGIPSWLKMPCIFLFVVTCSLILFAGIKYLTSPDNTGQTNQAEMYQETDSTDVASMSIDSTSDYATNPEEADHDSKPAKPRNEEASTNMGITKPYKQPSQPAKTNR